jgi:hypothetical protein
MSIGVRTIDIAIEVKAEEIRTLLYVLSPSMFDKSVV